METSYSCNKNVTFSLVGGFPKTPPQNPPFHRQSYIWKSSSPGPEARSMSSSSGAHVLFLPTHKFGLWWLTGPLQIIWLWVYGCAFLELSTVFAFTSEWERVRGSLLDLTSLVHSSLHSSSRTFSLWVPLITLHVLWRRELWEGRLHLSCVQAHGWHDQIPTCEPWTPNDLPQVLWWRALDKKPEGSSFVITWLVSLTVLCVENTV